MASFPILAPLIFASSRVRAGRHDARMAPTLGREPARLRGGERRALWSWPGRAGGQGDAWIIGIIVVFRRWRCGGTGGGIATSIGFAADRGPDLDDFQLA